MFRGLQKRRAQPECKISCIEFVRRRLWMDIIETSYGRSTERITPVGVAEAERGVKAWHEGFAPQSKILQSQTAHVFEVDVYVWEKTGYISATSRH